MPAVLEAVRAAKVGTRVQLEGLDTGESLALAWFGVVKSAGEN